MPKHKLTIYKDISPLPFSKVPLWKSFCKLSSKKLWWSLKFNALSIFFSRLLGECVWSMEVILSRYLISALKKYLNSYLKLQKCHCKSVWWKYIKIESCHSCLGKKEQKLIFPTGLAGVRTLVFCACLFCSPWGVQEKLRMTHWAPEIKFVQSCISYVNYKKLHHPKNGNRFPKLNLPDFYIRHRLN